MSPSSPIYEFIADAGYVKELTARETVDLMSEPTSQRSHGNQPAAGEHDAKG